MARLSRRALEGLRNYQYKAGGYTWLDEIHGPFWDWLVTKLPLWLAPNLITLIGTFAIFASYLINAYYLPDFEGTAPRWVYVSAAVGVFVYMNMDCVDGKQARRTGTSSPLGQLFDHGCDALVVHWMSGNIMASVGIPFGWRGLLAFNMLWGPWMLSHLEEYHTGMMMYGNPYFGILEIWYTVMLVHLTAAAMPSIWHLYVFTLRGTPLYVSDVMTFCIVTACIVQALPQLYRIMTCDAARMPKRERGHKETGPAAVARHVLLVVACMAAGIVWLMDPGRGPGEVRYVYVAYGVSYAWVACELIMAHMAKEPFRPPALPTALLLAGAANGWLGPFVPRPTAAVAVSAAVVLLFLHYVVTTIRDICAFLDIPCLTIRPKSAAAQR